MSKPIRLQKIIADAGICSRREAEDMVEEGMVTINGKVAKLGDKADPNKDHIKIGKKLLKASAAPDKVVIALFKPRGVMSYNPLDRNEQSGTVFEYFDKVKEKIQPVGRLETEHEGLLLLTNDGDLSQRLTRAKYSIPREYHVKIDGHLTDKKLKRLTLGVEIEGRRTGPMEVKSIGVNEGKEWYKVITKDPRHRIIKKIFEFISHPIDKVRRNRIGPINLMGLQRGQYRYLSPVEITELYKLVGLEGKNS